MLTNLFRETRRSASVSELRLLETGAEPGFDHFTDAAAHAFDAPFALLSLIYDDRQWFKATHGIELECIDRSNGFCNHALDIPGVLECCDPQTDARFARLPVVIGEPHVRYYIGAPLTRLNGVDVGALCVLDTVIRKPASPDQKAYLAGLARQAALLMETRRDGLEAMA